MSSALYTVELLRLATAIADYPRLKAPAASIERRSVVCGSRVSVDLDFDAEGRVTACGLSVHACALGQASAALLARSIAGRDAATVTEARDRLLAFLKGDAAEPGDWPGLVMLASARGYPVRHSAILLPFEAAADAAAALRTAA